MVNQLHAALATITDTSHTIMELEDGSTYTITVTASNAIGNGTVSESVSGMTNETGKYNHLCRCTCSQLLTLGACTARVTLCVCLLVCLCVLHLYSSTTSDKTSYQMFQQL